MTNQPHLKDVVKLDEPEFFLSDPKPVYERMHRENPVMWMPDVNAFAVSKYDDVQDISRSDIFSTENGIMLNDAKYNRNTAVDFFPPNSELIVTTDRPRHHELRRVIQPVFHPQLMAEHEGRIRAFAYEVVATIEPGVELDFVEQVAVPLPIKTIAMVLGLEDVDVATVRFWTDEMVKMGAPVDASEDLDAIRPGLVPLQEYVYAALEQKRKNPGGMDDLLSILSQETIDNQKVSDLNILSMAMAILVAGNETTRNLMSCMTWTLSQHPDQLARVSDDRTLVMGAVEESLRWMSPVIGHSRSALHDTEVRGVEIKAGQYVHLLYAAANHDAEIFDDPHTYDIGRIKKRTPHIAFGGGAHMCPGQSLARLEARILLEELLERFASWEVVGEPTRNPSILHNSFVHLPLRFTA